MTYNRNIFPFTFTSEAKDKVTGEYIEKEYECQGTAYIAKHTGVPVRTIEWRAKNGLIPNSKRMGIGEKKRITYFWLTQQADEYIRLVNSGQVKLGRVVSINPDRLGEPANDEIFEEVQP